MFQLVLPCSALGRLVVDAHLPEADPARQPLEEAVALRQLAQRRRRARRQQAEIAGILRDLLPRAPVDQAVEHLHAEPAQPRLALAVRLGGVDDVVAVIEPMADQRVDQRRRMLAVAVHEQHRAEAGVVEAGQQRRLLAEIARQRDHLHVERFGRQRAARPRSCRRGCRRRRRSPRWRGRGSGAAAARPRRGCRGTAASPPPSLNTGTTIDRPAAAGVRPAPSRFPIEWLPRPPCSRPFLRDL